jgi:hypothetical protein
MEAGVTLLGRTKDRRMGVGQDLGGEGESRKNESNISLLLSTTICFPQYTDIQVYIHRSGLP